MATLAPQVPLGHAGDDAGATCEFGTKQLETETAGFKGNQLRRTEDVAPSTGNFGAGDMATLAPQIPFGNTGDIDRATGPLGTKQLESETAGFKGNQLNRTEDVAPSTGNFGAGNMATLAPQSETAGFKGNQLKRTGEVEPSTGNFGAGDIATLAPQVPFGYL